MNIQKIINYFLLFTMFVWISQINIVSALDAPLFDESKVAWTFLWRGIQKWWSVKDNDLNWARSTNWLKWDITNEIWVKWKMFNWWVKPSWAMVWSWYDFNWDWGQDILYWFGGKLYLQDLSTGISIWETKALAIGKIISVESLFWDTLEKQIVVQFSEKPYMMWVLDWKTWEIIATSYNYHNDMAIYWLEYGTGTPIIKHKDNWEIYIIFSWSSTYNFGMKLYEDWWKVLFEPLYNDNRLSSTWGGWKRENRPAIWTIWWKEFIAQNWRSTYNILNLDSANIDNSYIPTKDFSVSRYETHYAATDKHIAYDFNDDWNDEYIMWAHNYLRWGVRYQDGFVIVWWKSTTDDTITQYWSLETDYNEDNTWLWVRTVRVAKNYSNLDESALFVLNANNPDGTVREWYIFNWSWSTDYSTWNVSSTFNTKLDYVYDWSNWSISWVFNNGVYDLVVLRNGSNYDFYKYSWSWSFSSWSTAEITGSFYWISAPFDDELSSKRVPWNFTWVDSDWNGIKEFIVSDWWYFKFYEIYEDNWYLQTRLVKELKYSWKEVWSVLKRWLTSDLQNVWSISYESSINQLHVYYSDFWDLDWNWDEWLKKVNAQTYAWWRIKDLKIVKIHDKNYILYNNNLYDAENASPNTPPVLVKSWFGNWYVIDVDPSLNDWNEYINWWKTYTINDDFSLTEKYSSYWMDWDFDWDGILDRLERRTAPWAVRRRTEWEMRTVSWKDWSEITPREHLWWCMQASRVDVKFHDYNWDWIDDILLWWTWCTSSQEWIYDWTDLSKIIEHRSETNIHLYDTDWDWNKEWISKNWDYAYYTYQINDIEDNDIVTKWTRNIPSYARVWDSAYSSVSLNRDDAGTNMTVMVYNWRLIWLDTTDWSVKFDNYYYWWKAYSNMSWSTVVPTQWYDAVFQDLWVPVLMADAITADIDWDWKNDVVAWSYDWNLYIIDADSWDIKMSYNIWTSIKRFFFWDTNNDGILDILVSSEDWYIYQFANSNLNAPVWVKDWPLYWYDIQTQLDNKIVYVNFESEAKATWYFIQLYNKTEKSVVFDWKDIWNNIKWCIASSSYPDALPSWCILNDKDYSLNGKSIYVWRVMSYNDSVTSEIVESNWFSVLNVTIDKKVKLKEDFNWDYVDSITVAPWSIIQYKIVVNNDSLISLGWLWYLNYDVQPPVPVTDCDWITDCRTKNLIINDYMPTTFSYMSNSTIIKVEDINDWNIWKSVSDSYFVKDWTDSETSLSTTAWATLRWKFPSTVILWAWDSAELIFDAIAK